MTNTVLRLGILGATNAIQATYLPVLRSLKTHYTLTIIYDPNEEIVKQCQTSFGITHSTTVIEDVLLHKDVDVVLNLLPVEYHEQHTVTALESGKDVMVEAPLAMSIPSLRRIREATKKGQAARSSSNVNNNTNTNNPDGPKVFVGCARRYAPCFTEVFKKELSNLGRIQYARCRNIAGPVNIASPASIPSGINEVSAATTVKQLNSPEKFSKILEDVFGEDLTPDRIAFCRYLGMLGCHDLSLMRESLGFPDAVSNVAITAPFYSAIFHYTNSSDGHPFTLVYEAGIDAVPRCDAHLTVYGADKTITVEYDFPRPGEKTSNGTFVRVVVEEAESLQEVGVGNGHGNGSINGKGNRQQTEGELLRPRIKRTETVCSCEEAYERQFMALHSYLLDGDSAAKTTTEDAFMDLRLLLMIFEHYNRQCGTIRTPLG
jgi:predicted dehydrogenase